VSEPTRRELTPTDGLIRGGTAEAKEGSDLLNGEGDAMLEIIEGDGSDRLCHVGTS
jgi:hypothetical protein